MALEDWQLYKFIKSGSLLSIFKKRQMSIFWSFRVIKNKGENSPHTIYVQYWRKSKSSSFKSIIQNRYTYWLAYNFLLVFILVMPRVRNALCISPENKNIQPSSKVYIFKLLNEIGKFTIYKNNSKAKI